MVNVVSFKDRTIPVNELISIRRVYSFWKGFTRLELEVPNFYTNQKIIIEWIEKNLEKKWGFYEYQHLTIKSSHKMVIFFEDQDEAIMFKLKTGGKPWE